MDETIRIINKQLKNIPNKKEKKTRISIGKFFIVFFMLYVIFIVSVLTYVYVRKQINKCRYYESQTDRLILLNSKIDELTEQILKDDEVNNVMQELRNTLLLERKDVIEELGTYF